MAVNHLALGGGVLVAAAAIGGGVYASGTLSNKADTQKTPDNTPKEIKWRPASEDSSADADYAEGKYANKYKRFLVGVTDTAKQDSKYANINNDTWWNHIFNTKYSSSNPTENEGFHNLTGGTTGNKTLKKACEQAYKGTQETSNGKKIKYPESGNQTSYSEIDIWKLCSPLGTKPTTIEEAKDKIKDEGEGAKEKKYTTNSASEQTSKLGGILRTSLISTVDKDNDMFWKIRDEDFKANLITAGENETFFNNSKATTPLKNLCAQAYEKGKAENSPSGSEDKLTEKEVKRFCSLEKVS